MSEDTSVEEFAQLVLANLQKKGFPAQKVAFPLDSLYESAHRRGVNFNRVLDLLGARHVAHEKTPEKVIFMAASPVAAPAPFAGLDPGMLQGMSPDQMIAMAAQAMQQMSPEQLQAIQSMVGGMSDEERAQMIEQAKKLGLMPE